MKIFLPIAQTMSGEFIDRRQSRQRLDNSPHSIETIVYTLSRQFWLDVHKKTRRTKRPHKRKKSQDKAYTIAYNAVLQAGRALKFSQGYRPDGANQHVSVVKFVELFS